MKNSKYRNTLKQIFFERFCSSIFKILKSDQVGCSDIVTIYFNASHIQKFSKKKNIIDNL